MGKRRELYRICNGMIRLMAAGIVFVLFLHSIFSTSFIGWREDGQGGYQKRTLNIADSPWKHMAAFLLLLVLLWLGWRGYLHLREKGYFRRLKPEWVTGVLCVLAGVSGVLWILITQLAPGNDPSKVYTAAMQWRAGDFSAFEEGGYLFRYPFQSGIVLFYYLLSFLTGAENYVGLQLFNAAALAVIDFFLAKLSARFWKEERAFEIVACVSVMLFLPMLYYTTYLYGILPGMAFALAALYQLVRYLETRRYPYMLGMALCIGVAIVLKSNCLIYLVAIVCFLLYDVMDGLLRGRWKKQSLLSVLCILLCVGGYVGCDAAYQKAVEKLSGYELTDGAAMISWVVMGLQDSAAATGPGEYNGYIIDVFQQYHYDTDQITEVSLRDIKTILQRMADNPLDEGVTFFAKKMAFQWNDPTFAAMERTEGRRSAIVLPAFAKSMIDGEARVSLTIYLNYLQTLVWIGVLLYLYLRKKSENLYELMGVVVFLGGYFFHFFWESGASYTLPYFLLLFPYAARGFLDLVELLDEMWRKYRGKKQQLEREKNRKQLRWGLIFTGVLFVLLMLFQTTNLFRNTIALDDGADAEMQFYQPGIPDISGE